MKSAVGVNSKMELNDAALWRLFRAIASGDRASAFELLDTQAGLAQAVIATGATRQASSKNYLSGITSYIYKGDTALHIAAAAHRPELVRALIGLGANVGARNRRGAEPLHYAAVGAPGASSRDAGAQSTTIACLIEAGADPNATDKGGIAPLHRAIRSRSAEAVKALLASGANPQMRTGRGSTAMQLATGHSGKSGSGSPEAKAQQALIVQLLASAG